VTLTDLLFIIFDRLLADPGIGKSHAAEEVCALFRATEERAREWSADNVRLRAEVEYLTAWKRDAERLRRDLDAATDDLDRLLDEENEWRTQHENALACWGVDMDNLSKKHAADLARVTADNAELEGALQGTREALAVCVESENRAVADLARVTGENWRLCEEVDDLLEADSGHRYTIGELIKANEGKCADLYRVTAENVRLRALLSERTGNTQSIIDGLLDEGDKQTSDLARVTGERDALREAAAAEVLSLLELRQECGAKADETLPAFVRRLRDERDAQTDHAMELIDQLHGFKDQRDALLAAAKATIDTFEPDDPNTEPTYNTPCGDARAALRAAVAACKDGGEG